MDFAAALGKLKKVSTNDRSQPITVSEQSASAVENFKDKIHSVNLENWYEELKKWTFDTAFISLSQEQAQTIVSVYKDRKHDPSAVPSSKQEATLSALRDQIDAAMSKYQSSGAFVRLSTRSPKDAAIARDTTMKLFNEEIALLGDIGKTDENARLIALIKASTVCLKVFSGQQALDLLLASERTHEDLNLALEFPQAWDMKVIVREWVTIHPSMEFRGFVCKKKFTALSQYFHIVHFPELVKSRNEVLAKILAFYEDIKDAIPADSYIIDFGVLEDRVVVIELNPFNDYEGCGTDPGLFNWKADRELLDGHQPFEFRVREGPFDVKPNIIQAWREIVKVEHADTQS